MPSKTIVFIHGMYMTPLCWENWVDYFQAKGYRCLAPGWPGRDRPVEELRKIHPDPEQASLNLPRIVEHYAGLIRTMDEKPILIGHSMGGLVTQLLLQSEPVAAGIAIDSAPPQGIFTARWAFIRSNLPHINPFSDQRIPIRMSLRRFCYTFANGLPPEQQQAAFEKYVVPESRRIAPSSLTRAGRIDFSKAHAPLLLVAGGNDHLIPARLNRSNWKRYKRSASTTDLQEFPGRAHFIIGQSNWREVADFVGCWINEKGV
jgi:pimeloyl-ACP methyl ester carboxylesterase